LARKRRAIGITVSHAYGKFLEPEIKIKKSIFGIGKTESEEIDRYNSEKQI
jgi:hypothetical protein